MKNKKILLIFAAVIFALSCSNKNGVKKNNIKNQQINENVKDTKNIKNLKTEQEYLKSIDYSNIADKVTQNQIREILENAKVNSGNIDLFLKSVNI